MRTDLWFSLRTNFMEPPPGVGGKSAGSDSDRILGGLTWLNISRRVSLTQRRCARSGSDRGRVLTSRETSWLRAFFPTSHLAIAIAIAAVDRDHRGRAKIVLRFPNVRLQTRDGRVPAGQASPAIGRTALGRSVAGTPTSLTLLRVLFRREILHNPSCRFFPESR